jgi:hypothetical protein
MFGTFYQFSWHVVKKTAAVAAVVAAEDEVEAEEILPVATALRTRANTTHNRKYAQQTYLGGTHLKLREYLAMDHGRCSTLSWSICTLYMLFHSHFTMKSDNIKEENDISHWKHDATRHYNHNENFQRGHLEHDFRARWTPFISFARGESKLRK